LILTSSTTANNESFMDLITNAGDIPNCVTKSMDWDYNASKTRIVEHLHVREFIENQMRISPGNDPLVYNFQLLSSEIDFDDRPRVSALGGLLCYLQKNVFTLEQQGNVLVNKLVPVESMMKGHCVIDPLSLRALSIFVEEVHPLMVKGKGRSKEGFSVFGVLDRTSSGGGKRFLRDWFRSPLSDLVKLVARQDGVAMFMIPEYVCTLLKKYPLTNNLLELYAI
jgi:DNA mismatch repair ATPase MutS